MTQSALNTQIGGCHYKDMAIQPMEFSMANGLDACQHTIIKYVSRFRDKGGVQDLEKAKHVIDMLIEFEGKANGEPEDDDVLEAGPASDNPFTKAFFDGLKAGAEAQTQEAGAEPKCTDRKCKACYPVKPSEEEIESALNLLLAAGVIKRSE